MISQAPTTPNAKKGSLSNQQARKLIDTLIKKTPINNIDHSEKKQLNRREF